MASGRKISRRKGKAGTAFLAAGAAIFGLVLLAVIVTPMLVRDSVVGPIDSWFYIAKGEQLLSCPLQDCPALNDLLEQGSAGSSVDETADTEQRKLLQRVHYMYHAAHSVSLAILNSVGVDWETALNALSLTGAALIIAGLTGLLYALWGAGPAGLGLLFLTLEVFPGYHGLHWVVPSNVALGLGICCWAAVLLRPRWLDAVFPAAILVLVWMHPTGRAYGALALALYFFVMSWREKRAWTVLTLAGLAWATPGLAALAFPGPTFSGGAFLVPDGWNYWQGVRENSVSALEQVAERFGNPAGLMILAGAATGLILTPPARRRSVWLMAGLLFGMVAASIFHTLPGYPAELFRRLWVPLMVMIIGSFSYAAWITFTHAWKALRSGQSMHKTACSGIAALVVVFVFTHQIQIGVPAVIGKAAHMVLWGTMPLDTSQPERILQTADPGKRILYMNELPLYLYLAHGGTAYGSIYYPAIKGTDQEERWLREGHGIDIAASSIPEFFGKVLLPESSRIEIAFDVPVERDAVQLRVDNPLSGNIALQIEGFQPVTVAAKWRGWVTLFPERNGGPLDRLSIDVQKGGYGWISGIRVEDGAVTAWPWHHGMTIRELKPAGSDSDTEPVIEARFSPEDMLPESCRALDIVDDTGAIVVMRVDCSR